MAALSNLDKVTSTDRQALGPQPDNTPVGPQSTTAVPPPGGGVTKLVAGSNITLTPATGVGVVQIDSTGGNVSVVTRADLRALSVPADGTTALEQGYLYPGDGGGGTWFFEASDTNSVDNDGTTVVPGGVYGDVATVGAWHRLGSAYYGHGINDLNQAYLELPWFGGIANETDVSTALNHAVATLNSQPGVKQAGRIHLPSGTYRLSLKVVIDMTPLGNVGFSMTGDGPGATVIAYGLTAADTCMLQFTGISNGSLRDMMFQGPGYVGVVNSPKVVWFNNCTAFTTVNVQGLGLTSTADMYGATGSGGVVAVTGCTLMSFLGCYFSGSGYAYFQATSSVVMTACSWICGATTPCVWLQSCNSNSWTNNFFQGAGPTKSFASSGITSTSSTFTVTTSVAHNFFNGQYFVIRNATHTAYNGVWKISSSTATTLTVTSAINPGSDSCLASSLWSCLYFGGQSASLVTESSFSDSLLNTPPGGYGGPGSVGIWLDAFISGTKTAGLNFSQFVVDYGGTAIFGHGATNSDPSSTCAGININNCKPNGGPRDAFGCIRLEGCVNFVVNGGSMFPGNNPPGTGATFNCIVISDGGQSFPTQDITVTGIALSDQNSSALYPSVTAINGIVLDGANVKRVSVTGVGLDTTSAFANAVVLQNSATLASSIVTYRRDDGRLVVWDSTGSNRAL